jgi:hypothetical protein
MEAVGKVPSVAPARRSRYSQFIELKEAALNADR